MISSYLRATPGWILMATLAWASGFLSSLVEIGGKHPVEAAVIAILVGIVLRNLGSVPTLCEAGVALFEKPLIFGIVLIGAGLDFRTLLSQGFGVITIVITTMLVGGISIYFVGRLLGLTRNLNVLLCAGTIICGGTAIAVIAPLIHAKEEETSYAIGTIALWGLIAILVYPTLGQVFGASDFSFGVFAGTAIHSTPQVVGAGFIFSELAGKTATAVKLLRNCMLAPIALMLAVQASHSRGPVSEVRLRKAFPWFLFAYFVMAGLRTTGYLSEGFVEIAVSAGKFFILMGMVGVGLNTRLSAFKNVGYRPLAVGFFGSLIVAGVSITMIRVMLT